MVLDRRHEMLRYNQWKDKAVGIVTCILMMIIVSVLFKLFTSYEIKAANLAKILHGNIEQVKWDRVISVSLAFPFLNFAIAIGFSEIFMIWHSGIWWYGKLGTLAFDLCNAALCLYIWNNGVATLLAICILIYSFSCMLSGRQHYLWLHVLKQISIDTKFVKHRLTIPLTAFLVNWVIFNCMFAGIILIVTNSNDIYSIGLILSSILTIWVSQTIIMFLSRGSFTAHFIQKWFLHSTVWAKKSPVSDAFIRLLTGSFGSISLAASYYGGRNGLITFALIAWHLSPYRMSLSFESDSIMHGVADLYTNIFILQAFGNQKYRSLYHVVAYSYSFAESLMLADIYPPFKIDLIHTLATFLSFIPAFITAVLALLIFVKNGLSVTDSTRIAFVVGCHGLMTAQLVFEPWRAGSFVMAAGLSENPKPLLESLLWLSNYYPSFL